MAKKNPLKMRCAQCGDIGRHRVYTTLKGAPVLCQKCAYKKLTNN